MSFLLMLVYYYFVFVFSFLSAILVQWNTNEVVKSDDLIPLFRKQRKERIFPSSALSKDVTLIYMPGKNQTIVQKESSHSFSLVYTTKRDRLWYIPEIVKLWRGNIVFVIYCLNEDRNETISSIVEARYANRISFILYSVRKDSFESTIYPMNAMRNIGIRFVQTSHFAIIDMDEWLSPNLYDEVNRIPNKVLDDSRSAIVIPIIFINYDRFLPKCTSFRECIELSLSLIPRNMTELKNRILSHDCQFNKRKMKTHVRCVTMIVDE